MGTDIFGQMPKGSFVRLFFGFYALEPTRSQFAFDFFLRISTLRAIFGFDFFLRITPTCAILKTNQKKRGLITMRVLLRYKEPVCLLLSFAAILLVVTVYGLTHGFDSSATVDHKSPQILQELLPVDE